MPLLLIDSRKVCAGEFTDKPGQCESRPGTKPTGKETKQHCLPTRTPRPEQNSRNISVNSFAKVPNKPNNNSNK